MADLLKKTLNDASIASNNNPQDTFRLFGFKPDGKAYYVDFGSLKLRMNENLPLGVKSIGNLVTGANQMIYTTGADTYAAMAATAYGRSLIGAADAAAVRGIIDAPATAHSHSADDITSGVLATTRVPDLDAAKITSGTFAVARIPNLTSTKITGTANRLAAFNGTGNLSILADGSADQYLKTDGAGNYSWGTPAGGGNVTKVGTPTSNQVGIWTGDGTLKGDNNLLFQSANNMLVLGGIIEFSPSVFETIAGGAYRFNGIAGLSFEYDGIEEVVIGNDLVEVLCDLDVAGTVSKSAGSFQIDHPLFEDSKWLLHSFIEGPQADNIYRGRIQLKEGQATVSIDEACDMTPGTFDALNTDVQIFLQNNETCDQVRGHYKDGFIHLVSDNWLCDAMIDWMVIGERKDAGIKRWKRTDDNGHLIPEWDKTDNDHDENESSTNH